MTRSKGFPWVLAVLASVGCARNPAPSASNETKVTAQGVRLELKLPEGQMVVRGDRFTLVDGGNRMQFEGNASIEVEQKAVLKAKARRIAVERDSQRIELKGNVKALFFSPKRKDFHANR